MYNLSMNKYNYLRLLLVTKPSHSKSFDTSLVKLIQIILFESENYSLTISQIRKQIEEKFNLEFTENEIENSIHKRRSDITKVSFEKEETLYILDSKRINIFKKNEEDNNYNKIIDEFSETFDTKGINKDQIEEILSKYFYHTFNSNISTLLLLLNNRKEEGVQDFPEEIGEEEKEIINNFLNWDNKNKNKFIFELVSYCIDYCMLTIKKDFSLFRNLFEGKNFYLDANIIFRMAGVDNQERKNVIDSFINKCKKSGIVIKYTIFTYKEICDTVKSMVGSIKGSICGKKMVSVSHFKEFLNPYTNLDFYRMYQDWCNNKQNKYNDFDEFYRYIIKIIDNILKDFEKVVFIDLKATYNDFNSLHDSLSQYKNKKNARYTQNSVAIDINNYIYILKLRQKSKGSTLLNIADYFITADANLCDWGKLVFPGVIPIAVLPSVWHSLILKFTGRTNDDYKAFTLFLNLRYRIVTDKFDGRRPRILSIVQSMDEPVEIKEMILRDINEKLTTEYEEIIDEEEIVEVSKKSVIQTEAQKIFDINKDSIVDEGRVKGKIEAYYSIAEKKANRKIIKYSIARKIISKKSKIIIGALFLLSIIGCLIFLGLDGISNILSNEVNGLNIFSWISIVLLALEVLSVLLFKPLSKMLKKINVNTIKEKEYLKLIKQYDKPKK